MLKIFNDIEQGTESWHKVRLGVITASCFDLVIPKTRGKGEGRLTYQYKLASERIREEAGDSFSTQATERGHEFEGVARELYSECTGNKVLECGFMLDTYGYSPDGTVEKDGLIEIKTKAGHLQIAVLISDIIPEEHVAQIQGGLMVSGREWCDFISFCPGLPIFIKRAFRDEKYISDLRFELAKFNHELKQTIEQITNKF